MATSLAVEGSAELAALLARPLPRYTSYPTVPLWSSRCDAETYRQALQRAGARALQPLSLYVHLPFCKRRCWYCGCNVLVSNDRDKMDSYVDTVAREIEIVARLLDRRRTLARVHLGGGTPTALAPDQLEKLWDAIESCFVLAPDAERAVEVDPRVTTEDHLRCLGGLGFRRLSVGVQDLDPGVQAAIGRIQSYAETVEVVDGARRHGFTSLNIDLVYGLPRQTPASFSSTIEAIVKLRPERVAAFAFAYLPDALPLQRRLPVADMPTPAARVALRAQVAEALESRGYVAIGMDHWALPDDDLAVALAERRLWRDFQGYTTRRARETIGVGTSAISDIGGVYAQNALGLSEHRQAVYAGELATHKGFLRTPEDELRREVILGLLCNLWVDLATIDAGGFAAERAALQPLVADGLLEIDGDQLTVTERGRPFLRNIASVFDAHLTTAPGRFSSSV